MPYKIFPLSCMIVSYKSATIGAEQQTPSSKSKANQEEYDPVARRASLGSRGLTFTAAFIISVNPRI